MHRVVRAVAVFIISSVVVPIGVAATVIGAFLFLPLPATLPAPKAGVESQISHVYLADGKTEIAVFRRFETSIPVEPQDIPKVLKDAVVASEDRRFYKHGGVDPIASLRAFWADLRGKGYTQGGSTIAQQYVKNAYTGGERTLARKLREAILASQLSHQASKEEILYKYLTTIYFGSGAYGIGAASETYFRKKPNDLTVGEAALLAGLIPAPTRYDPRNNADEAEARRMVVLGKMLDQHYITQAQYDDAAKQKVFVITRFGPPKGPATIVYPPEQENPQYPYFVDYLRRYLLARYGPDKVFQGGLKIYVTLDPAVQSAAETAVADALKGTAPPLDMSLVAVEPPTGYVKALVGGRDFAASQVNLALGHCPPVADTTTQSGPGPFCVDGGGTGRQPGSAFKPFTLAKAFEEGISPTRVYEAPNVYTYRHCTGVGCTVHNVEGEGGGAMTIRQATWHSVNTVFAQLVQDVGPNQVADLAHRVGITMIDPKKPHYPSITLGAEEVSPLDMASAYGVFAARGQQFPPTPVLKVLDNKGNVLEDHTKPEAKSPSPISEVIADNVTDVLRGVITSGTGTGANIGRPAAGKTGTTENYGNAWFVGYTPTLSTAVWMGYADAPRPLLNIKGVGRVYGGTIPAQTWRAFMLQALKDVPVTDFNQPAPIKPIAQDLARQLRNGFDPGDRRYPSYVGSGGPYQYFPPAPVAVAPATTTTTIEAPPTTESPFPGEPSTTSFLPGPG